MRIINTTSEPIYVEKSRKDEYGEEVIDFVMVGVGENEEFPDSFPQHIYTVNSSCIIENRRGKIQTSCFGGRITAKSGANCGIDEKNIIVEERP